MPGSAKQEGSKGLKVARQGLGAARGMRGVSPVVSGLLPVRVAIGLALACLLSSYAHAAQSQANRAAIAPEFDRLERKARDAGEVRVLVRPRANAADGFMLRTPRALERARRFAQREGRRPIRTLNRRGLQVYSLNRTQLARFVNSGEFDRVVEDRLNKPTLAQSVPFIGADAAHALGITGNGVAVAILDTGVEASHVDFGSRVVEEACFSTTYELFNATTLCPDGQQSQTGPGAAEPCVGECSHGTHVASIAAGVNGVAPDASIIAVQVFSWFDDPERCDPDPVCVLAFDSDTLAGLEYVESLTSTYTIAAANMSLGGGQFDAPCDASPYKPVIDDLASLGVASVASAGNDGYSSALGSPACVSSAVSVGSVSDTSGTIHEFSNSASFLDVLAPGGGITAAVPGGNYARWWGTSMAAPHVAGAFALVRAQEPAMSVADVLALFTSTGAVTTDSRNGFSFSRLDVAAVTAELVPTDGDEDGIPDLDDNCPDIANADQADFDGDGIGFVCDATPGC